MVFVSITPHIIPCVSDPSFKYTFARLGGNINPDENGAFQEKSRFFVVTPPKTVLGFHESHVT